MGLIFKDTNAPVDPKTERLWTVFFYVIIGIIALIGVLALVLFAHDEIGSGFRMPRQMAMGLLSAVAVCGGLIALLFGVRAKKEAIKLSAAMRESDEHPWLKRKDWAAGRITPASRKASVILWIFVFFWCAASVAISIAVVPGQLQQGNRTVLVALIFPVIGLALFVFAWRTTRAWRRFGQSIFEMSGVPAPLGGALQGQIQFRGKSQPAHGWHVALTCLRRTITGPTNNLRTIEKVVWRDEKWLRSDLPQKDSNATSIPVFFQLPADKPESTVTHGDGTHWRLEAWAQLSGPNFETAFEVPVFKLPETPAPVEDPTIPYQVSLDEIRKQIHSQTRVVDLPDRKEFIFPAGRNPGFVIGAAIFCLIWTLIVALLVLKHAPLPFPLIFGAIDLLMLYFVGDLWFRHNRVTISATTITAETGWLTYKKENSLKTSGAVTFLAESGAVVGHTAYYDLKLRTRDGMEWTLAKNLSHKPEADWLARQMTAAAKNFATTEATRESQSQKSPAAKK